jgi:S-adenosylmethionine-diacylglycerol 3-amino-3-carboxypropyl transferase
MFELISKNWFHYLHSNHIIYNCCWEDPRLDRIALKLDQDSEVLVLTSAGCNALDYALAGAKKIHAVDVNAKQNALLELKIASAKTLTHETFFELFGKGQLKGIKWLYANTIRKELSIESRKYWDDAIILFEPEISPKGFYFRGTSGFFAQVMHFYFTYCTDLQPKLQAFLNAKEDAERKSIYFNEIKPKLWNRFLKFFVGQPSVLAFLGVPKEQQHQVESGSSRGMFGFIEEALDAVFGELNFKDNYFWRLYLTGSYLPDCCPEYLRAENFSSLQNVSQNVKIHTNTVTGFLSEHIDPVSHFVLLDHMDWLAGRNKKALQEEWQEIIDHSSPSAKIIWRSGAANVSYVNPLQVQVRNNDVLLGDLIKYDYKLAAELHPQDRVHTYGSFYIGEVNV